MLNKPWELDGSHYGDDEAFTDPFINLLYYRIEEIGI